MFKKNLDFKTLFTDKSIHNVIDLGGGSGSYNYSNMKHWSVCLIDQKDTPDNLPANVFYAKADLKVYMPTQDVFDLVILKYVIEHQPTMADALDLIRKAYKSLKLGGYALFVLPQGHCLSNTIYKALFNIKLAEGLASTKDGGHWSNYDKTTFETDLKSVGFNIVKKKILPNTFEGYPYDIFLDCIAYYKKRGYNLTDNELQYLCRK